MKFSRNEFLKRVKKNIQQEISTQLKTITEELIKICFFLFRVRKKYRITHFLHALNMPVN